MWSRQRWKFVSFNWQPVRSHERGRHGAGDISLRRSRCSSSRLLVAHGTLVAALWIFGGFETLFFGFLLPMALAAALGGYLFYAQHSFPGMRILREKGWTGYSASMVSSSYLRLGPILRWFTGNIGFHHVHHLNSLIPFYETLPENCRKNRIPTRLPGTPKEKTACHFEPMA